MEIMSYEKKSKELTLIPKYEFYMEYMLEVIMDLLVILLCTIFC